MRAFEQQRLAGRARHTLLHAALDGLGVAIGPAALVAHDVAAGRLVQPFAAPSLPPWRYVAYVPGTGPHSPASAAFVAWLVRANAAEAGK